MNMVIRCCGIVAALSLIASSPAKSQAGSAGRIDRAVWAPDGGLVFPDDADRWITVGSGIGGEYSDEPFDPANPGTIGVVQMEPAAYDYFLEHREYADGTMFLLSFYRTLEKPEPELPGFMQGELAQREIHMIDRARFSEEGRAFFIFAPGAAQAPAPMPLGSTCFVCHMDHGDHDGTFVQFYPLLREHLIDSSD